MINEATAVKLLNHGLARLFMLAGSLSALLVARSATPPVVRPLWLPTVHRGRLSACNAFVIVRIDFDDVRYHCAGRQTSSAVQPAQVTGFEFIKSWSIATLFHQFNKQLISF